MPNTKRHTSQSEYSALLARRLRLLRESNGFTQEHVAERAGIAAYTYQKFEKGESKPGTPMNPRLSTLISLADVFGITVTDLLSVDFDVSPQPDDDTALWNAGGRA